MCLGGGGSCGQETARCAVDAEAFARVFLSPVEAALLGSAAAPTSPEEKFRLERISLTPALALVAFRGRRKRFLLAEQKAGTAVGEVTSLPQRLTG